MALGNDTKNSLEDAAKGCIWVLGFTLVAILGMFLQMYTLSYGWNTFLAPLLNVPKIGMRLALVLFVFVGLFRHVTNHKKDTRTLNEKMSAVISTEIVAPLFSLFLFWILS